MKSKLVAIASVLLVAGSAWAQEDGTPKAKIIFQRDPAMLPREAAVAAEVPNPQSANRPELFRLGTNVRVLDPVTAADIARADFEAAQRYADVILAPPRVGLVRNTGEPVLSLAPATALETPQEDGQRMWTMAIRSPEAKALRLSFTGFDAPGVDVLVYSNTSEGPIVRGPFTGRGPERDGDFWTAFVPGEVAYVEAVGAVMPSFNIAEIVHFDRHPGGLDFEATGEVAGGTNGGGVFACHLDARCESVNDFARRATGQMNFNSGGGSFVCTGTLLNDNDDETFVPYFLTAFHCLNTQAEVNTLMVVWFWEKDSCNGTLPNFNNLPTTTGGALLETNTTSPGNDMTFMRLTDSLPGGIAFAGWTTATSLDAPGAHGMHHPSGSWRRATFFDSVGFCPGCLCVDGNDFDYYNMIRGLVEGGSSGSGIFDSGGRLAGQLLGRCDDFSDPDNMDCTNIGDYWALYGEFEETHPIIDGWLAIGGTIHVNALTPFPFGNGTAALPFRTVGEANSFAWDGVRIKITPASYPEAVTISKAVQIIHNGAGMIRIGG